MSIEELLHGQHLPPEAIENFVVESEVPETYTSSRIAETVKKVYTKSVTMIKPKNRG